MNYKYLVLIMLASLLLTGCGPHEEVRVGFIGPLSGQLASYGESAQNGAILAQEHVNRNGGINGKSLEIVYEDTECKPADAVSATRKLIDADGVDIIIGELCSTATVPAYDIAEREGVLMVSYASVSPSLDEGTPYLYRVWPSDGLLQSNMAELVRDNGYVVSVLYVNDEWGTSSKDAFVRSLSEHSIEPVLVQSSASGARDFRTQLEKVRRSGADALYLIVQPPEAIAAIRQAREMQLDVQILGGNEVFNEELLAELGSLADGALGVRQKAVNTSRSREFSRVYEQRFGTQTGLFSAFSYDAVVLIADAMRECGESSQGVVSCLEDLGVYDGASGQFSFDENGDSVREFERVQIIDSSITVLG